MPLCALLRCHTGFFVPAAHGDYHRVRGVPEAHHPKQPIPMNNETVEVTGQTGASVNESAKEQVAARLSKPYKGPLEVLAHKHGISMRDVVDSLPEGSRSQMAGERFIEVLEEVAGWGDVLLILNTEDGVFECKGPIVPGSVGAGYYNLGHGSAISGHLRYDRCCDIYCVRRDFHGMDTCSIQFFNAEGGCMFKLFVGRGEDGQLQPSQVERFERLSGLARVA